MVRGFFPRSAPAHPWAAISRSTVHLATSWPCARRCNHILRAPNRRRNLWSRAAAINSMISASRSARLDGSRDLAS